jgi:hypothetical protein
MLLVTVLAVVFCLSVGTVDLPLRPGDEAAERAPKAEYDALTPFEREKAGVDAIDGQVTFLFGAVRVPWAQYRDDAVRWLQLVLAGGVADALGLVLALVWTAAFLPTFVDPGAVTVLLAKPVPRWSLLAGKYVGVVVFFGANVTLFIGGTWLALAARTGVWSAHYLLAVPLVVLHFAVFFSFSALLAVWTRSTIACVVGSLAFWVACWGVNFGRQAALAALAGNADVAAGAGGALELGYWLFPKPADFGYLLAHALQADRYFPLAPEMVAADRQGALVLEMSVVSSGLFSVVMLAAAGYEWVKADY